MSDDIASLGPWFHNLHLPDGRQTAPDHPYGDFPSFKWRQIGPSLPSDLTGMTVLDIGCNAGFYSFELAKRGGRVTGLDVDPHYLAQARWGAVQMGLEDRVEFRQGQVYQLAEWRESFDLVLFMGVFYHLRYPLLGLDLVASKVKRWMVFQSLSTLGEETLDDRVVEHLEERHRLDLPGWPKMAFLEHGMLGDPTNTWVPNRAGIEAMLRNAGMRLISRPGHEIYLAEPDPQRPSCVSTWNRPQLEAAALAANRTAVASKNESAAATAGNGKGKP
jgi:tRNA (mo5U34)-methyltransferase